MTDSSMKDFDIVKVLGKGSFGSVYLVRRKEDKKIYALKSVILEKLNKKEQQNSVNEVRILASVNHPNVIGYKEAFWDDNQNTLNIVMEYADDGDLQTKIIKMRKEGGMFKEDLIWSYSIQMIEGLKALHDKKIMHRDLKSANIFLVKDKHQCKLGDMNVSKVIKEKELLTQTGTPYYASPEVWRDEPYSYKSDLWSIGCVIYELCALRPPFKGKDLDELFVNVCKGKMDRISHVYSDNLWKMIQMLLQVEVDKRCDCDKFLNSKLITKKIHEMKNENQDYKNLEINKEINDGDLLDTIRFDNIMDIKKQLPTKKNYSIKNAVLGSNKLEKKENKKIDNLKFNEGKNKSNKNNKILKISNIIDSSNSLKYQKTNNNKKIVYNNKNIKIISKNKSTIKSEIKKEKVKEKENVKNFEKFKENELGCIFVDLASDSHLKKIPNSQNPKEKEITIINLENKNNSSVKTSISRKNKILKNSPKIVENGKSMIYQKPKLYENSIKREKKNICLVNKPMTTKRTVKKMFIVRNITPKRDINEIKNKSQHISSMKDMNISSKINKSYKNGYTSVNREKIKKNFAKPIETSPGNNDNTNLNKSNPGIYLNILKKKNNSTKIKKDINQRAKSTIPSKKKEKSDNNNLLEKNTIKNNINKEKYINNNQKFISNRENMINMFINNYNKKNDFKSFNENNNININKNKNNYMEKQHNTNNNYNKNLIIDAKPFENKNLKKILYPNNKIKPREKKNFSKKRIINKNIFERDLTEPELLKMINPIKINDQKREYQKTLNISLNNQEKNSFLQKQKANKMIRFNTNNNQRYYQNYSNNTNQNNPQIFYNYVSINNLVTPNFPVKLINVFGK